METVLSRHGLGGLAGDLDVDVNAMMLQPFRGQPVLMVGPLPLDLAPGCGLLRVDAQAEFAEREQDRANTPSPEAVQPSDPLGRLQSLCVSRGSAPSSTEFMFPMNC